MTNPSRRSIDRSMPVLLISQLIGGIIAVPCHTFLPAFLSDLGLSAVLISTIFTSQRVMGLISSLAGGALSDYLSPKQTLLLGQIGLICAALAFSTPSIVPVIICWSIYGFGTGLHALGGQTYLIDNSDPKRLGMFTALYYWGNTVGGAAGGPIAALFLGAAFLYPRFSLMFAILAGAGLALTAAFLPSSDHHGKRVDAEEKERNARFFGYGQIASYGHARLLAGLRFFPTFCYGMMTIFVPLVLRRNGASAGVLAAYVAVSSISAALCQFAVGKLADSVSPKLPTIICYVILAASSALIGVFSSTLWGAFIPGVIGISAAWSLSVLMAPLVARSAKPEERGRTLGFMHLFWNAGMILGSIAGGFLFEAWIGLPFFIGSAAVLVCPVLVVAFFRIVPELLEDTAGDAAG